MTSSRPDIVKLQHIVVIKRQNMHLLDSSGHGETGNEDAVMTKELLLPWQDTVYSRVRCGKQPHTCHQWVRQIEKGPALAHVLPLPVWPYTMMVTLKPDSAASMSCVMPHMRMTSTCKVNAGSSVCYSTSTTICIWDSLLFVICCQKLQGVTAVERSHTSGLPRHEIQLLPSWQ